MLFSRTSRRRPADITACLGILVTALAFALCAPGSLAAGHPTGHKYTAADLKWVQIGATVDPTRGQAPYFSPHHGMSFAELLEAGANAGMRPDITELLGLPRTRYGMPMETAILIRLPGSSRVYGIWKNDVGSGQWRDPYFKIDLHPGVARALGVNPYAFKGNVEVAVVP